jgi:hypothetical protein
VSAARLSTAQITAALNRAHRRDVPTKAATIRAALRSRQLGQPPAVAGAYAATVRAQVAILTTLNTEIATLEGQVEAHFGQHPDAEIYLSQPGLGVVLGARVLAEFGDDTTRYADAKARKNYAGTSPITRQSGKKKTVLARYVHNDRLLDALNRQAFAALRASPRSPRLLRPAASPRRRSPRRAAPTRQPPGRHPARLPQDPHNLRRDHRLGTPPTRSTNRCVTQKAHGMSSRFVHRPTVGWREDVAGAIQRWPRTTGSGRPRWLLALGCRSTSTARSAPGVTGTTISTAAEDPRRAGPAAGRSAPSRRAR